MEQSWGWWADQGRYNGQLLIACSFMVMDGGHIKTSSPSKELPRYRKGLLAATNNTASVLTAVQIEDRQLVYPGYCKTISKLGS